MTELGKVEDKDLVSRTAELARRERGLTVELLNHLREAERRQLFLELGYPSLYEYVIKELKYSEGAAYRRIQAMRLIRDLPEASQKITSGKLTLCNASKVQKLLRKAPKEEKWKIIELLEGKSSRETDRELARLDPSITREATRWLSAEEVQLIFSLDRPSFLELSELQSLRSHVDIGKSYKVLFRDLIYLGQEKWNPLRRAVPPSSGGQRVSENREQHGKSLPLELRREIWKRDEGACRYRSPDTGKVCGSRDLVQIDHIQPLALGGKNEPGNLRLLCAAHNRIRAEATFGGPRYGKS